MATGSASSGEKYAALVRAVRQALVRHERSSDPLVRAAELGGLLAELHQQVLEVSAARDEALLDALRAEQRPSNRAIGRMLGISHQRVDQLSALARRGRNRPTR